LFTHIARGLRAYLLYEGSIDVILRGIMRAFQYVETCAVMIIIVGTVTLIDVILARIRQSLIQRKRLREI